MKDQFEQYQEETLLITAMKHFRQAQRALSKLEDIRGFEYTDAVELIEEYFVNHEDAPEPGSPEIKFLMNSL